MLMIVTRKHYFLIQVPVDPQPIIWYSTDSFLPRDIMGRSRDLAFFGTFPLVRKPLLY